MPAPSNRAPLLLAIIVALGVGGRLWRERGASGGASTAPQQSALDLQLARAERAATGDGARAPRGRRPRAGADSAPRAKGRGRGAREASRSSTPDAIRSEQTPPGAIPPEAVRSYLAFASRPANSSAVRSARPVDDGRRRPWQGQPPPIDVERASAAELERLPRIGPALAKRIMEDRLARGPFGSLEGLQRVRGIGPAMARQLQGHVTFGGAGRP